MWWHLRSTVHETLEVKRAKVKVTRSCDVVAQKHQIYPVNVTRLLKCICLIGNRGRRSEWRGHIFDRRDLEASATKLLQDHLQVLQVLI